MEISALYSSPKYFPMASLFTQNENQNLYNSPVPTQSGSLSPLKTHSATVLPISHSLFLKHVKPMTRSGFLHPTVSSARILFPRYPHAFFLTSLEASFTVEKTI